MALDPRAYAVRGDLADLALADRVFAPHYAQSCAFRVTAAAVIHRRPKLDSESDALVSPGEVFYVLDIASGWAWGHGETAGTVGYVEASALILP